MKKIFTLLALLLCSWFSSVAEQKLRSIKQFTLESPDGEIQTTIYLAEKIVYTIVHESDTIIAPSPISMQLNNQEAFGLHPRLKKAVRNSINQTIQTPVYKRAVIEDKYNELTLQFKGDYSVIFRSYNDGVAYRFSSTRKKDFLVINEEAVFNFNKNYTAIVPYVNKDAGTPIEEQFESSFENYYVHIPLTKLSPNQLAFLPLAIEVANGKKVVITESDLESYPGMFIINKGGNTALTGLFPHYPAKVEQGGHNQLHLLVKERKPYIAKVKGDRSFPWRAIVIASSDKELADNDMVYKLASPTRIKDISWIKPGKVAWEWWNDANISGVDFRSGVNNDTYKYYIDFASDYNMEYVILDEGWAVNLKADLMQVIPEIDLQELVEYGKNKNVGIILWAGYYAFDRDMERVVRHYANMGVKGFKVDFMDRDDQKAVDFYYRTAELAAKYHLLIDFHGAYKPTGLQRTYPNVVNFEGVMGMEHMKWAGPEHDQVTYDVTMPFIRMLAGPVDYTQGAMRNATKQDFHAVWSNPMSQGTRTRQLAEYVVFESPLNMLADNPTIYRKEPESTRFIAMVPEVWDNTIALEGKIGKYIAIARKKENEWYIGALTNWDARKLELDLSFLGEGTFKAEVFQDGINADKQATDFKHHTIDIPQNRKLKILMAPGGGFVARIYNYRES